jgi:hypothetical protein
MGISQKNKEKVSGILKEYNKDLSDEQKKAIAKRLVKYIEESYKNLRTITIKASLIKKYVATHTKDPALYLNIVPSEGITKKVIQMNNKKLNKLETFKEVPKKYIDDTVKQFRNSDNLYELAYYILLTTGRRMGEVIKNIDKFKNKPRDTKKIYFSGILKKRGDAKRVEIITLDKKTYVLKAIRKFKKKIAHRSFDGLRQALAEGITRLSGGYKFKSHDLRTIYANYLFQFRNPTQQIYNPFIAKVLHHKFVATSINYTDITISK